MSVAVRLHNTQVSGEMEGENFVIRNRETGEVILSIGGDAQALPADFLAASAAGRAAIEANFFNLATVDDTFATGAIGEDRLAANELTGRAIANVADANVIGGIPVLFRIDISDASGDTDVVVTNKIRVIDAWGVNTGIAAHGSLDTWQVKNGSNAISDAVAKTATINGVKRIGTIDPARAEIAAGGTLKITAAKNTNAAVTVYVLAIRVA